MNDPFYEFDSLNTPEKKRNDGPFATAHEASQAKNGELMVRISKMNVKEFVDNN